MSVLERISDYIVQRTDTNRLFADTCAAVVVATAVGNKVYIADKIGDLNLNIFGIIIGGSGISNKTVAIKIARAMLERLSERCYPDLEYNDLKKYGLLAPTKFTPEAMTKWFVDKRDWLVSEIPEHSSDIRARDVVPEGTIIGDEYSKMFSGAQNRDYLATTLEYVSTLYDGYVESSATIGRGVESVKSVYSSFLSASTFYLLKLMNGLDFFIQGNGTRMLWTYDDSHEPELVTDDMAESFFQSLWGRRGTNKIVDELVAELFRLRKMVEQTDPQDTILFLHQDAAKYLGNYHYRQKNEAIAHYRRDKLDPDANYISRLAQNAIKLAGIHAISRYTSQDFWRSNPPIILLQDAEWGVRKVEAHYQDYLRIRQAIELMSSESSSHSFRSDHQKILNAIDRCGGKASISQLLTITRWKGNDLTTILTDMTAAGMVTEDYVRTGGRPAKVYKKRQQ